MTDPLSNLLLVISVLSQINKENINIEIEKEIALDWAPKGSRNRSVNINRRAFPLDDEPSSKIEKEKTVKEVIDTDFNATYSENTNTEDILDAVKTVNPYLHSKNQIILKAIIKSNSLIEDVKYLLNNTNVESNSTVKSLSLKEGLKIAKDMGPYLNSQTKKQVDNLYDKINNINNLHKGLVQIKSSNADEIQIDYILENLKPFIAFDKYNKIKQLVSIVKVIQTTSILSNTKSLPDSESENEQVEENKEEQLDDIINLLDKIDNKKNSE
ncbi:MAG: hypothetical protein ACOWWH_09835 [Eubacteriaceae bacterium]